jgi:hypothetical protein
MIYALIDSTSRKLVMLPIRVTLANEEREHIATAIDYITPRHSNSSGRVRVEVRDSVGALMYEQSFFPHVFGFKIVELNDDENIDADVMHNDITETYDVHIDAIVDSIKAQRDHITSLLASINNDKDNALKDRLQDDLHNAFFSLKIVQTSLRNLAAYVKQESE